MATHHRIITASIATIGLALGGASTPALASQNLCGDGCDGYNIAGHIATSTPVGHPSTVASGTSQNVCGDACDGYRFVSATPAIVRISPVSGGFDWGDAGIGAAGGLALSLLGVGSVIAVSQRRTRRRAAALTS
jgi:hypothetical protein